MGKNRTKTGRFAAGHSGNPEGRPRRLDARESRGDGWTSLLSGLGTRQKDAREALTFCAERIDWRLAEELWLGDDLAARIIETPANEMTREGFEFCVSDDTDDGQGPSLEAGESYSSGVEADTAELKKEIEHQWQELGLIQAIRRALCFRDAYGGSVVLLGAKDGATDLSEPLGTVRELSFLTALEPREIQPILWYGDPSNPKYGRPAVYQLTPSAPGATVEGSQYTSTVRIHESRLLVFDGTRVTNRASGLRGGWGGSVLDRVYRVLRDFNLSWGAAGLLVVDFAQAVYKMDGLATLLESDDADLFKSRLTTLNMSRAVTGLMLTDKEDEYTRVTTPLTGLPDLLDRFLQRLSMAANLPVALLGGDSPGGINASGASSDQLRMWYDRVKAWQLDCVVPAIRRVTELQIQALGVTEPAQWAIEPRPLWQPSQQETTDSRLKQSQIDVAMINAGVLSAEEVRRSRYGGRTYSYETTLLADDVPAPLPAQLPPGPQPIPDPSRAEQGDPVPARLDFVKHEGDQWYVYSEEGKRLGHGYATQSEADERLREIEAAKHAQAKP